MFEWECSLPLSETTLPLGRLRLARGSSLPATALAGPHRWWPSHAPPLQRGDGFSKFKMATGLRLKDKFGTIEREISYELACTRACKHKCMKTLLFVHMGAFECVRVCVCTCSHMHVIHIHVHIHTYKLQKAKISS